MQKKTPVVVPYDPQWPAQFNAIRDRIFPVLQDLLVGFEHVGSTSVPGIAAKPVIDVDAIYDDPANLPEIIRRLKSLGHQHEGNRGIEGRESFETPAGIRHNFYVCLDECLALRNHLTLRDHLRSNSNDRDAYGNLKMQLAHLYEISSDDYVEAKTEFILKILRQYDISTSDQTAIEAANRAKKT